MRTLACAAVSLCVGAFFGLPAFANQDSSPTQSSREGIPHDPELLDKLHSGRVEEVGADKLDLVAVLRGFETAGLRIRDKSDLNPGATDYAEILKYFSDPAVTARATAVLKVHPNFLGTIAKFEQTGGNEGEWSQVTYKNLVRLVLARAKGAPIRGSTPQPAEIVNPEYKRWKGFAPGATAVYSQATRNEKRDGKSEAMGKERIARTLVSFDQNGATIDEITLARGYRRVIGPLFRGPAERALQYAPMEVLGGREFQCNQTEVASTISYGDGRPVPVTTTYSLNDNVPGHVVRLSSSKPYRFGGDLIVEETLLSYHAGKDGDWSAEPMNQRVDLELLEKLHSGNVKAIGPYYLDLVAVLRAFEAAGTRIKESTEENPTPQEMTKINDRFGHPELLCPGAQITGHPLYQKTVAQLKATGGSDSEWSQTTYKNLIRFLKGSGGR